MWSNSYKLAAYFAYAFCFRCIGTRMNYRRHNVTVSLGSLRPVQLFERDN